MSSSIKESLNHEVVHYDYRSSFFDIFVSVSALMNKQLCDLKTSQKHNSPPFYLLKELVWVFRSNEEMLS